VFDLRGNEKPQESPIPLYGATRNYIKCTSVGVFCFFMSLFCVENVYFMPSGAALLIMSDELCESRL